jgi:CheY-like chemotaxis protein
MGGDVVIEASTPELGSTVVLTIDPGPIDRAAHHGTFQTTAGDETPFRPEDFRGRLSGVRVVVAEDSPDNQLILRRILRLAGVEVEMVQNGAEAIEHAITGQHDLVLMDVQMPLLDGHDATEELRRRGYTKPIIALTAHAMPDERERSLRVGCNDHLTKPINHKRLLYVVAQYAGRRLSGP